MSQERVHGRSGEMFCLALVILYLLVVGFSFPMSATRHTRSGSADLSPGHVDRQTVDASAGERVSLTYEADLMPIEFALIPLDGLDRDDFPSDTDLGSIYCLYHKVAMYDEIAFTATKDSSFLLFARNIANVTQEFQFEWTRVNPEEGTAQIAMRAFALSIPIAICGILAFICRKRHEQLLRQDKARGGGVPDDEIFYGENVSE
ncbi:MAG: hypothetical protein ACFFET_15190 [Candidatus Thorarchaeota archaeon]